VNFRINCTRVVASAMLGAAVISVAGAQEFVRGRVLVKFRSDATSAQKGSALRSANARATKSIGAGIEVVELPSISNERAVAAALDRLATVEFAELDAVYRPDEDPNDPLLYAEWHLTAIKAREAWALGTGQSSVVIAILDTGVEATHPDLAPNLVPGWNVYNNNNSTGDVFGHGTAVAGTASAVTDNSAGVASLAWGCRLMPIRISDTSGNATSSTIASGLNWAIDHGARVANVSYAGTDSSTVKTAAQNFYNRGGVVVMSAGNQGITSSAADNPYIITVSATDGSDLIYSWSNRGSNVDVAAPGSVYTTVTGGAYASNAGTSFSSPIVASLVALMLSHDSTLTPNQIMTIVESTADDLGSPGWDSTYAAGRVNAQRAIEAVRGSGGGNSDSTPPVVSVTAPANWATVTGTVTLSASASDNVGVSTVSFYVNGNLVGNDSTAPYSLTWNSASLADGTHTISAKAFDAAGNNASASISVTSANASDTTPPTVGIIAPTGGARVSKTVSVTANATDNVRVVRVELYVNDVYVTSNSVAPFTTKWNTNRAARGTHTLKLKAFDATGNSAWSSPVSVTK
jgi:thermitase